MDRSEDTCDGDGVQTVVRTGPPVGVARPAALGLEEGAGFKPPLPLAPAAYVVELARALQSSVAQPLPPEPIIAPQTCAPPPSYKIGPPPRPLIPRAYRQHAPFAEALPIPVRTSEPQVLPPPPAPPLQVAAPRAIESPFAPLPPRPKLAVDAANVSNLGTEFTVPVPPSLRPALALSPATAPARPPVPSEIRLRENVRKALKFAAYAFAGYLAFVQALIIVYRFVNPPMSSLMLQQRLMGQDITQDWVPIEKISPQIVRAVLLSEDGRFCQHHGIDLLEMQAAIDRASDGIPRGASTISMQVTKNLFLWPSKSYIRKAIEIPLTLAMELWWPKRRIMEVYLNIAEWGPGIFGVEAASRFHFDKAASRLNEREAAKLAVALPSPFTRDPGDPGPRTLRLAGDIQGRMRGASPSQTACVLTHRRGQ